MVDKTIKIANAVLEAVRDGELSKELVIGMLAIKLFYVDSIVRNASVRKIASILNCGKDKAAQIIKELAENDMCIDEDGKLNIFKQINFHINGKYEFKPDGTRMLKGDKRIGGHKRLFLIDGKIYIKRNSIESKGYDITYLNLKKILTMLIEVNYIQLRSRKQDQGRHCSSPRFYKRAHTSKKHRRHNDVSQCPTSVKSLRRGISYETLSKHLHVSLSTVKKYTKELIQMGALESFNPTDLKHPSATLFYDEALYSGSWKLEEAGKNKVTAIEYFKIMSGLPDPILVAHESLEQGTLNGAVGSKTVKSFITDRLGEDGQMHTFRLYYRMFPNQYRVTL